MRDRRHSLAPLLATVFVMAIASRATAQERTTATYDDWVVQCRTVPGPPPAKLCDMVQIAQVQGRNTPFSSIAIVHPVLGKPVKLVVQVPVNIAVAAKVRIQAGDSDPGLVAPFDRCVPTGCFAEFEIPDDALRRFRTVSGAGKVSFQIANGREISIPLSFKGFGRAFDALAKE